MIKKVLSVVLIIYFFTAILYAKTNIKINLAGESITATKISYNKEKYLIDKIFYISQGRHNISKTLIEKTNKIEVFWKTTVDGYLQMWPDNINVICNNKNQITWFWSDNIPKTPYKSLYIKFTENINWEINNTKEYYLQVKCKTSEEDISLKPLDNIELKEKDVLTNDNLSNFAISTQYTEIPTDEAKNRLTHPNPALQPKFIEIIYYQIITIDKLIDSLETLGIDLNTIFVNTQSKDFYKQWINRFTEYNNIQSFADDFDTAVTLKDIWIADNIVNSLSSRILCEYKNPGTCNQKINIDKTWKFEFYTLDEILANIYKWANSTYANTKKLFRELKTLKDKNYNSISNTAEKNFVIKILTKTFGDDTDIDNNFSIWYALKTRMDNIDTLKSTFESTSSNDKVNIRWIYNFYYEFANASKGYNKWIILKKWIDDDNLDEAIKKVVVGDAKNLLSLFGDTSYITNCNTDCIENRLKNNIISLLQIKDDDFNLNLVWCTPWSEIKDFLNLDNIKTNKDFYELLLWITKKAYNGTIKHNSSSSQISESEWLYNIEDINNITINISNIAENSDSRNTYWYYFADTDKNPISGKVIIANSNNINNNFVNMPIVSSDIPSEAKYLWFWMWAKSFNPQACEQCAFDYHRWDTIIFTKKSVWWWFGRTSGYSGTINNKKLWTNERKDFLFFSHQDSNPNKREIMKIENGFQKWRDSQNGSFDALSTEVNLNMSDSYDVYLDMWALLDGVYGKYFNITECYNPINDPNLILYYNKNSFMGGGLIDDLSSAENDGYINGNGVNPSDDGIYFGGSGYIKTTNNINLPTKTIEISFNPSNIDTRQVIYEEWGYYKGIDINLYNWNLFIWLWDNPNASNKFFIQNISNKKHIIKIIASENGTKIYLDWTLITNKEWVDLTDYQYTSDKSIIIWWSNLSWVCDWSSSDCLYPSNFPLYFQWTIEYIKIWNIAK